MTFSSEEDRLVKTIKPLWGDEAERARWQRLHRLLSHIEARRGLPGLARRGLEATLGKKVSKRWFSGDEAELAFSLRELTDLYHRTVSDLAKARSERADPVLIEQLNLLVGRAYSVVYSRPGFQIMDVVRFFLHEFPCLVRGRIHFLLVAVLIFACGGLVGFLCFDMDSKLIGLVIPKEMRQGLVESLKEGKVGGVVESFERFNLASKIMFNNMQVAFLAFATGLGFGIGTVYLLILNGMLLGGLAAIFHQAGFAAEFWSLILPHGSVELPCIFIGAAGGLILGFALLNPGKHRRGEWLNREGYDAVKLVVGTLPLLVAAGIVETYITPAKISIPVKYSSAFILSFLTAGYLFLPPGWVLKYLTEFQPDVGRQNR